MPDDAIVIISDRDGTKIKINMHTYNYIEYNFKMQCSNENESIPWEGFRCKYKLLRELATILTLSWSHDSWYHVMCDFPFLTEGKGGGKKCKDP